MSRKASIKETGEELSPAEWARFEHAVQDDAPIRPRDQPPTTEPHEPSIDTDRADPKAASGDA